jgi:hypothetical protein
MVVRARQQESSPLGNRRTATRTNGSSAIRSHCRLNVGEAASSSSTTGARNSSTWMVTGSCVHARAGPAVMVQPASAIAATRQIRFMITETERA